MRIVLTLCTMTLVVMLFSHFKINKDPERVSYEAMIANAVDYYIQNYQYHESSDGNGNKIRYKVFESRQEFLDFAPDCCWFSKAGSEGYLPGWFVRWRTNFAGVVFIHDHRRKIVDETIIFEESHIPLEVYMTAGGDVIPEEPRR